MKTNKSISRKKFFGPKSIFCHFKNGQKSISDLGKSLKLLQMQFHEFCLNILHENIQKQIREINLISRIKEVKYIAHVAQWARNF